MLVRQEKIALLLLFMVAITLTTSFIILENLERDMFVSSYSGDSQEGALVVHKGSIERVDTTRSGGHLVLDVSAVTVFIPEPVARTLILRKGDMVEVYGIVKLYRGEKEIVVEYEDDLILVKKAGTEEIS